MERREDGCLGMSGNWCLGRDERSLMSREGGVEMGV